MSETAISKTDRQTDRQTERKTQVGPIQAGRETFQCSVLTPLS